MDAAPVRWPRVPLLVLAWFDLVSALVGMAGLSFAGGMGIPLSLLDGTAFDSYVWPGIILGLVVGGAQALALVAQHGRFALAPGLHVAAGLVMMTWIFAEVAILRAWSPLHGIYFAAGLVQVVLAVLALGTWPQPFLRRLPPAAGRAADARHPASVDSEP